MSLFYEDLLCLLKTSSAEGPEILESEVSQTYKPFQHVGDSVAHAHWVGSLDNSSHATKGKKCANGTSVTGQNILPAGVYPGILWPRPIYTPRYILAQANPSPLRPQYPPGYKLAQAIPGYNLAWAALTPYIIRAASNL